MVRRAVFPTRNPLFMFMIMYCWDTVESGSDYEAKQHEGFERKCDLLGVLWLS